jgi:hypothetical protein
MLVGALAWAQNIEVQGSAWFATADGNGRAGIGLSTNEKPVGKLHVASWGGFADDGADGTTPPSGVPIVAQSDSTAIGILNQEGRAAFALNIDGNLHGQDARGIPTFYDKYDGYWHDSLSLLNGSVGIGTWPSYRLDVNGQIRAKGSLRTWGTGGWLNETYQGGWMMQDDYWVRTYNSKAIWSDTLVGSQALSIGDWGVGPPSDGAVINGSVGIGTTAPDHKLDVRGAIAAGNSDIYFTHTNHKHTGIGNSAGYAAIENSVDYGTLIILGRAGTSVGRRVDVWDYLQVNGRIRATDGIRVYAVTDSDCAPVGTLTTNPTCKYCIQTYSSSCISWRTVNNTPKGLLVDG